MDETRLGGMAIVCLIERIRAVLLTWEKLRVAYNLILLMAVMAMFLHAPSAYVREPLPFVLMLGVGAVLANLCFLAGPVVDVVFTLLSGRGNNTRLNRWVYFVMGTAYACLLVVATMLEWRHPA